MGEVLRRLGSLGDLFLFKPDREAIARRFMVGILARDYDQDLDKIGRIKLAYAYADLWLKHRQNQ